MTLISNVSSNHRRRSRDSSASEGGKDRDISSLYGERDGAWLDNYGSQQREKRKHGSIISSASGSSIYKRRDSGYSYVDDRFSQASNSSTLSPSESISNISKKRRSKTSRASSSSSPHQEMVLYGQDIDTSSQWSGRSGGSQSSAWSESAQSFYCPQNKMHLRIVRPSWARGVSGMP